ncbi:MAG: T9SS type A sorting domain-containing protein [Saprospiraceae bacterium]|nr:T9SS type A sorting domain-containing protein [Saprospiraceae bacterium]
MKRFYTFLILASFAISTTNVSAQDERYLDEIFDEVDVMENVIYSANATVLFLPIFGEAIQIPLTMDVYMPAGDTETNRPLVMVYHTGNFLPNVTNGGIAGTTKDSSVVEFCTRLARLGYVSASVDYRTGWNPLATTQPERALGLIQAAYRGIQDVRTANRYFRWQADMLGNMYGIDPDNITALGIGTGGYLSLAAATLDDYSEIITTTNPAGKFLLDLDMNGVPETPMVVPAYHGDINGEVTSVTPDGAFGLPAGDTTTYEHFVGYSSDLQLGINIGGALGDISWVDENTPPFLSIQSPFDIFAPYDDAVVIVPTTNDPVVQAQGSLEVARAQEALGNNDVWDGAVFDDPITQLAKDNSATAGHEYIEGLFPWIKPPNSLGIDEGTVVNWWDPNAPSPADGQGMGIPWNQLPHPTDPDNLTFHTQGLILNEGMSAEKSRANIDEMMAFLLPRMCVALELPCSANFTSSTEELLVDNTVVTVSPNPSVDMIRLNSDEMPMERVEIVSIDGKMMTVENNINNYNRTIDVSTYPSGNYIVKIYFEEGLVTKQIVKH